MFVNLGVWVRRKLDLGNWVGLVLSWVVLFLGVLVMGGIQLGLVKGLMVLGFQVLEELEFEKLGICLSGILTRENWAGLWSPKPEEFGLG